MNTIELISVIFGAGGLGTFLGTYLMFYKAKKRKENAEATSAELTNYDKLIAKYELYIDTLTVEQTSLKEEIRAERTDAREARKREAEERERVVTAFKERSDALIEREILRGQLALSEYNKCEIVRCNRRMPPRTESITTNAEE